MPSGYAFNSNATGDQVEQYLQYVAGQTYTNANGGYSANTNADVQKIWGQVLAQNPGASLQDLYSKTVAAMTTPGAGGTDHNLDYSLLTNDASKASFLSATPTPSATPVTAAAADSAQMTAAQTAMQTANQNNLDLIKQVQGYLNGGQSAADTGLIQNQRAGLNAIRSQAASAQGFGASGGQTQDVQTALSNSLQPQQANDAQAYSAQRATEYGQWQSQLATTASQMQQNATQAGNATLQGQESQFQNLYTQLQNDFNYGQGQQQVDQGADEIALNSATDAYQNDVKQAAAQQQAENSNAVFNVPGVGAVAHGIFNWQNHGGPGQGVAVPTAPKQIPTGTG